MICPGFIDLKGNNQDVKDRIKTYLFKSAFKCREDVIAKYWQSKSGKSGYSPLCRNEWKKGICKKPCRSCQNADYIPLSDQLVLDHFKGKIILGIYPLLKDGTCWFIAGDFDNHTGDRSPLDDVRAYYEACQVQDIPCYALKSKSGKGYHTYIFFDSPVPAWKARIVAFALLQEAGVTGAKIAGYFLDKLPKKDISTILLAWNAHNKPPLEETDIHKIVQSVFRYKNNGEPNVKRAKINISFG
jgi:hypothetical protein